MSAEGEVQPADDWMAEHDARPARVRYPAGWAWPGRPHPSCRRSELRIPPGDDPRAPEERWVLLRPAVPHDGHVLATGQTCPGAEGVVPATPRWVHVDRLAGGSAALARARDRLREAEREVARLETEVSRARALVARCDALGGRVPAPAPVPAPARRAG